MMEHPTHGIWTPVSKFTAVVFHPLFFPTYGALYLVSTNPHVFFGNGYKVPLLWTMVIFILTCLFPLIWMGMMKGLGLVTDLHLRNKKERIIPFIATATFYLWTYRMFKPGAGNLLFQSQLLSSMMLGASFSIFIGFFFNIFMKISLHSMAMGCFLGLLMSTMGYSEYDLRLLFVVAILVAGFVGSSRLYLNEHESREIYFGYLAGFFGLFLAFSVIPLITKTL